MTQTEAPKRNSLKNIERDAQFGRDLRWAEFTKNQAAFVRIANQYSAWTKRVGWIDED